MNAKLIIGLGNPGKSYELTRHNAGFLAVQNFASANCFPEFKLVKKFNSLVSQKDKMILALPQTFMNNSGRAVKKIKDFYKIPPQNILVIHDEIDMALGIFKICRNRGSAGHKGVQSIIDAFKTKNFVRVRIGITSGPSAKKIRTEEFVLKKFPKKELAVIKNIIKKIVPIMSDLFIE